MTDTSNSVLKESVSALVDGESNDLDLHRILKSLDNQEEAVVTREAWSRYQLASSVMKGDKDVGVRVDLSSAISEAIENETPAKDRLAGLNGWWSGIGKTAVAATVTFGVVFAAQQYSTGTAGSEGEATVVAADSSDGSVTGAVVPEGWELPPLTARTVSTNPLASQRQNPRPNVNPLPQQTSSAVSGDDFQDQINRLMFKHAEQVSSAGGMGVIPFARVSELSEGEKASNQ